MKNPTINGPNLLRVTVILDSGCFLFEESRGHNYLDIGYFESKQASDITAEADGRVVPLKIKLGQDKDTIEVRHYAADNTLQIGMRHSLSLERYLLRKSDLYPDDVPAYDLDAFDCTLRFYSGEFAAVDVTRRTFKQAPIAGGAYTGQELPVRRIANDVEVFYDVTAGEVLKVVRIDARGGETELLSSDVLGAGAKRLDIKFEADHSGDDKYFNHALKYAGQHCWLPNPDPPPVDGAGGN